MKFSSSGPKTSEIYFRIIKEINLNHLSTAGSLLKKLKALEGDSARVEDITGVLFFAQGNHGQAEIHFKNAIRKKPGESQYRLNLGNLYVAWNRWSQAKQTFEEILMENPHHYPALHNYALSLISLGDYHKALEILNKMKETGQDPARTFQLEGLIYFQMKDYPKALQSAGRSLDFDRNNPETFVMLGEIFRHTHRVKDSVVAFEQAVRLTPKNADNLISLALCYSDDQRFDDAFRCFQQALVLEPHNPSAHKGLSLIYLLMGDNQQSEFHRIQSQKAEMGEKNG